MRMIVRLLVLRSESLGMRILWVYYSGIAFKMAITDGQ